jgi:hypothetical protein
MIAKPEARAEDWGVLPHPIEEMQSAKILVYVEGRPDPFRGSMLVDRHPADDTLFSTVVLLSGPKTDSEPVPVRLPHEFQAAIGHPPAAGDHYSLTVPADFFDSALRQVQPS